MLDWQQRVIDEATELGEKLAKLNLFLADDVNLEKLSSKDIALLMCQAQAMTNYFEILDRRIVRFGG